MQCLYFWIDLLTLAGPLLLSFDKKVRFYKNWKALFLSIAFMMALFIPWDIIFTTKGIWGFNPCYLCGLEIGHLPIEEWMFFIVVPYACVFIYECCKAYFSDVLQKIAQPIYLTIAVVTLAAGLLNYDKWYTVVNLLGTAAMTLIYLILNQKRIGDTLMAYLVSLIPFVLVNGMLTGSFLHEPIVWYNDSENLGIRVFTIPLEDAFYLWFLLLVVLMPYEGLKKLGLRK